MWLELPTGNLSLPHRPARHSTQFLRLLLHAVPDSWLPLCGNHWPGSIPTSTHSDCRLLPEVSQRSTNGFFFQYIHLCDFQQSLYLSGKWHYFLHLFFSELLHKVFFIPCWELLTLKKSYCICIHCFTMLYGSHI